MHKHLIFLACCALLLVNARARAAANCTSQFTNLVRAPASGAEFVKVACNLTLSPGDVVTKRIILEGPEASGVTINCNNATLDGGSGRPNAGKDMIEIRSRQEGSTWRRPEYVTVENCNIIGSMRIYGMGKNGEDADIRASSRLDAGHVARVRAAAPRHITLDNLTITGTGRNPLYLAPGVTRTTLTNSEITGRSTRTGMYLDAESAYNIIRNNYFHVTVEDEYVGGIYVRRGPQLSLDNSSGNEIMNNRFSALLGGGIYTYRNCGEGGTVRHGTPSNNKIVNNVFYYKTYGGDNPSILLGSRGDEWWRTYCDDDDGFPWGSSADDRSFSRYNLVMQNQIYQLPVSQMIAQGDSSNSNNTILHNETVTTEEKRLAGCYVPTGYKDLLLHGQWLDVYKGTNGIPVCDIYRQTCTDGRLSYESTTACSLQQVPFNCMESGNNSGCQAQPSCPIGRKIVSIRAGCNLEGGSVSDSQLASVPGHTVQVFRESDRRSDGRCWVSGTELSHGASAIVREALDHRGVSVGCREHDKNGGDCQIRGILYCR